VDVLSEEDSFCMKTEEAYISAFSVENPESKVSLVIKLFLCVCVLHITFHKYFGFQYFCLWNNFEETAFLPLYNLALLCSCGAPVVSEHFWQVCIIQLATELIFLRQYPKNSSSGAIRVLNDLRETLETPNHRPSRPMYSDDLVGDGFPFPLKEHNRILTIGCRYS
jgi:hypothetical protein